MAVIGSIQGTSIVKLYKELGLESLKSRICSDIFGLPSYLSNLISSGVILITLATQRMLPHIIPELTPSNIHSSLGPFLNGIS